MSDELGNVTNKKISIFRRRVISLVDCCYWYQWEIYTESKVEKLFVLVCFQ